MIILLWLLIILTLEYIHLEKNLSVFVCTFYLYSLLFCKFTVQEELQELWCGSLGARRHVQILQFP